MQSILENVMKMRKADRNLLVYENLGGLLMPVRGVYLLVEGPVVQGERREKPGPRAVAATCGKAVK